LINPLRSEEDAFRFTLIVAALVAPVVIAAIAFSTGAARETGFIQADVPAAKIADFSILADVLKQIGQK
jgi:hypothetical protein